MLRFIYHSVFVVLFLSLSCLQGQADAKDPDAALLVLCYHKILDENISYAVKPDNFHRQIDIVKKRGYHPISARDLDQWLKGEKKIPRKSFLLTFDDGLSNCYDVVFPYLKEHRLPALFFVINDKIGAPDYLTAEQIQEMIESGFCSFGSHSYSHKPLHVIKNDKLLAREISLSRKELEKTIGSPVDFFAYPFGFWSDSALKVVKESGYQGAFTTISGFNASDTNPYELHRFMLERGMPLSVFEAFIMGHPKIYEKYYQIILPGYTKRGVTKAVENIVQSARQMKIPLSVSKAPVNSSDK